MERWLRWVVAILAVAAIIALVSLARGDTGRDELGMSQTHVAVAAP